MTANDDPAAKDGVTAACEAGELIACAAGLRFGLVPLVQHVAGWRQDGLYHTVFGGLGLAGVATWLVPLALLIATAAAVIALDEAKQRHRARR